MYSCEQPLALAVCSHVGCIKGHQGLHPRQVQQGQGWGSWLHSATPAPESQTTRMAEVTLSSAGGGRRSQDGGVSQDSGHEEMLGKHVW